MHRRPDLVEGGSPVANGIYQGGDFTTAVRQIGQNILQETDIRVFIGYCGWDTGELEQEVAEGSWEIRENYALFTT